MTDATTFRAGDVVRHGPTGETWTLAGDEESGQIQPCGWPNTVAQAADCFLKIAATDGERLAVLDSWAGPGPADSRKTRAIRQLGRVIVALAVVATLATATPARAEVITDPAAVCAAAKVGKGAWLDLAGLRKCLAADKLREVDAKEIQSLREALNKESAARVKAEAVALEATDRQWYYLGGGVSLGVLLTVLIAGAAS